MGWGWNLLGTAGVRWTPYLMDVLPVLQAVVLLGGLTWASITSRRLAVEGRLSGRAMQQASPIIVFHVFITVGMLWLLIG